MKTLPTSQLLTFSPDIGSYSHRIMSWRTERIIGKAFQIKDLLGLHRILSNPEVMQLVKAGKPYSFQESYVEFLEICSHYTQHSFGPMALEYQETGELFGICGLYFSKRWHTCQLKYLLLPQYQNRGLATEAARTVLHQGFSMGIERVVAFANYRNTGSQKVALKLGFSVEETDFYYEERNYVRFGVTRNRFFSHQYQFAC